MLVGSSLQHLWARLQREESVTLPGVLPDSARQQGRVPRKKACSFLLILLGLTGFKGVVTADPNVSPPLYPLSHLPFPLQLLRVYIYVECGRTLAQHV